MRASCCMRVANELSSSLALLIFGRKGNRRCFGASRRSAIAASGSVAAIRKYASERSPQAPGNPNINHD